MKIENSQLIIVMDEEWLADASYPVTVDPTFGFESKGGTQDNTGGYQSSFCKFTMPGNGTITNISVYLQSAAGTVPAIAVIYADADGEITGSALASSAAVNITTTEGWFDFAVNYVNNGGSTVFWIGWNAGSNIYQWYDSGDANQFLYEATGMTYPYTGEISPDGYFAWKLSIHADYTTGAALKTVTDSLGLSDSALRNKGLLPITDVIGLGDAALRNKTLIMLDSVDALDFAKGNKSPLIVSDMVGLVDLVNIITGAILKTVADAAGLTDITLLNKTVIAGDVVSVLEQVLRDKASVTVADIISAVEGVLTTRLLAIGDSVSLVEVVEAGVAGAKKTKLFLVIGDLALQITGD
jgi:hypothetical protein